MKVCLDDAGEERPLGRAEVPQDGGRPRVCRRAVRLWPPRHVQHRQHGARSGGRWLPLAALVRAAELGPTGWRCRRHGSRLHPGRSVVRPVRRCSHDAARRARHVRRPTPACRGRAPAGGTPCRSARLLRSLRRGLRGRPDPRGPARRRARGLRSAMDPRRAASGCREPGSGRVVRGWSAYPGRSAGRAPRSPDARRASSTSRSEVPCRLPGHDHRCA